VRVRTGSTPTPWHGRVWCHCGRSASRRGRSPFTAGVLESARGGG
jgi:hypothetical protein